MARKRTRGARLRELQELQARRARRVRIAVRAGFAAIGATALLLIWPQGGGQGQVCTALGARSLPAGYDLLRSALAQQQRIWLPAEKDRWLAQMREQHEPLLPAILWVLGQPAHPDFVSVAELAGALPLPAALDALRLVALRGPDRSRAAALAAVDRLAPLDERELAAALADEAVPVQLAALLRLRERAGVPDPLLRAMVRMLADDRTEVREAAFAAMPARLPAMVAGDLSGMLDYSDSGPLALQLLPRLQVGPAASAVLADRLGRSEAGLQAALLRGLGDHLADAAVQQAVWSLALGNGEDAVRVAALECLEQNGADAGRLPAGEVGWWPPAPRLVAARMLAAAGRVDGLRLLVDLANETEAEDPAPRAAARLALAHRNGPPPHAEPEEYRAWLNGLSSVPPSAVPAAPAR